jgi:hypothetical protein
MLVLMYYERARADAAMARLRVAVEKSKRLAQACEDSGFESDIRADKHVITVALREFNEALAAIGSLPPLPLLPPLQPLPTLPEMGKP